MSKLPLTFHVKATSLLLTEFIWKRARQSVLQLHIYLLRNNFFLASKKLVYVEHRLNPKNNEAEKISIIFPHIY